jgi:hypothetical protein
MVRASLEGFLKRKEFEYDRQKIKNYNGVDIAKNRKSGRVINLAKQKDNRLVISYLTKYVTKNNELFERLPFHSSHSISNLTHKFLIDSYEADIIWQKYQQQNLNPKTFKTEFFTLIFFDNNINQEVFRDLDTENEVLFWLNKE